MQKPIVMKTLNNLREILIIVSLAVFFTSMLKAEHTENIFSEVRVDEALRKAKSENKLVFLDFSARWCTPCKWMEETTFRDTRVVKKLSRDYVTVKVDIDQAEGAKIKKRYSINYLPTMLILNDKGQIVNKVEETLTPSGLLSMLDRYDNKSEATSITYASNTSPDKAVSSGNNDNWSVSKEEYLAYQKSLGESSYRLQIGAFGTSERAFERKRELEDIFIEKVKVVMDDRNGKKLYKVFMGEFASMSEAESFRKILKDKFRLDSIVN